MRLPKFILPLLLKLHKSAEATPYYHIFNRNDCYMSRYWLFGARSPERNGDNPNWKREGFQPPKSGRLYRWICRRLAIRAHTIFRSDSDRHLHDHPSWSISAVLSGGYWEITPPTDEALEYPLLYRAALNTVEQGWITERSAPYTARWLEKYGIYWRGPGAIVYRRATDPHRLVLPKGTVTKSIFALGKKTNSWGFWVGGEKIGWRQYLGIKQKDAA
jgi:hypothetical protein